MKQKKKLLEKIKYIRDLLADPLLSNQNSEDFKKTSQSITDYLR